MKFKFFTPFVLCFFFLGMILSLGGCTPSLSDKIEEELIFSGHAIDRKMGSVLKGALKKKPKAILTFAWKGFEEQESRGMVILVSEGNIYVARLYEREQLVNVSNFQFFPDTLIKVAIRDFDAISKETVPLCGNGPADDPVLSAVFIDGKKYASYSLKLNTEMRCNANLRKVQLLNELNSKFDLLPPIAD